MNRTYIYALCEERHDFPVKKGIFPKAVPNVQDINWLYKTADQNIPKDCGRLAVYVTGCQSALLAVVAVCARRHIQLTAIHRSKINGETIAQKVF